MLGSLCYLLIAPTIVPTCINFSGLSRKDHKDPSLEPRLRFFASLLSQSSELKTRCKAGIHLDSGGDSALF